MKNRVSKGTLIQKESSNRLNFYKTLNKNKLPITILMTLWMILFTTEQTFAENIYKVESSIIAPNVVMLDLVAENGDSKFSAIGCLKKNCVITNNAKSIRIRSFKALEGLAEELKPGSMVLMRTRRFRRPVTLKGKEFTRRISSLFMANKLKGTVSRCRESRDNPDDLQIRLKELFSNTPRSNRVRLNVDGKQLGVSCGDLDKKMVLIEAERTGKRRFKSITSIVILNPDGTPTPVTTQVSTPVPVPTGTMAPEVSPSPTAISTIVATPTMIATPTVAPTFTVAPPEATNTPVPTSTPLPTNTPEPTPTVVLTMPPLMPTFTPVPPISGKFCTSRSGPQLKPSAKPECDGNKGSNGTKLMTVPGTDLKYCVKGHPDCLKEGANCPLIITMLNATLYPEVDRPSTYGKFVTAEVKFKFSNHDAMFELPKHIKAVYKGIDLNRVSSMSFSAGSVAARQILCPPKPRPATSPYAVISTLGSCQICKGDYRFPDTNLHYIFVGGEKDGFFKKGQGCGVLKEIRELAERNGCSNLNPKWEPVKVGDPYIPDEFAKISGAIERYSFGECKRGVILGYRFMNEGHTTTFGRNKQNSKIHKRFNSADIAFNFMQERARVGGHMKVGPACSLVREVP